MAKKAIPLDAKSRISILVGLVLRRADSVAYGHAVVSAAPTD